MNILVVFTDDPCECVGVLNNNENTNKIVEVAYDDELLLEYKCDEMTI